MRAAVVRQNSVAVDRDVSRDILEFRARVLVIQAARRGYARAVLISDIVLLVYSRDCAIRLPRAVASTGRLSVDHAAASMDGHVPQAADWATRQELSVDR